MIKNGDFLVNANSVYDIISNIHWTSAKGWFWGVFLWFYMGNNTLYKWIPSVLLYTECEVRDTLLHVDVVTNMALKEGKKYPYSVALALSVSLLSRETLLGPIFTFGLRSASSAQDNPSCRPPTVVPPEPAGQEQLLKNLTFKLMDTSQCFWLPWGLSYLAT